MLTTLQESTTGVTHSPRADPHEGDGGTGEENRHEEEGLPAPGIRQRSNQRSRQKRQETLSGKRRGNVLLEFC